MNTARPYAVTVVRGWARLYTVGLAAGARHDRKAEIESDLWEHRNHAAAEGARPAATSLSILGRWAAGVPADLSWRASQRRRHGRTTKEGMMTKPRASYWWQTLAVFTAGTSIYAGIRQFFTNEVSVGVSAGKVGALILLGGVGGLTLLGLAVHRTMPRRGAFMVMIGVLPLALIGGFGIGIVFGLVASLAGGEGWWWVPVGIGSAVATASGFGAFSAWWHAARGNAATGQRTAPLPVMLVVAGMVAAGVAVGFGLFTIPLLAFGAIAALIGIRMLSRRLKTTP